MQHKEVGGYLKKIKGIKVRRAKLEDLKDLLGISYEFFLESMEAGEDEFNAEDVMQHILEYLNADHADVLVAENGTGIVGTIALQVAPAYYNHTKFVVSDHHFWVDPDYRNSSVVKCLVSAAKNWAKLRDSLWLRAKIVDGKKYKLQKFKG